uniref:Glucagon / GIP / secretin / VIP family domain-containing protein n=1 Tax=Amphiprion percula TaxID=161767 RepID=A0A3P8TK27_AMPPE
MVIWIYMIIAIYASPRWHSYRMEKGQRIIRNFKRHSDGTFTHDFTRYLDKMKAKDFVEWLASTKREG